MSDLRAVVESLLWEDEGTTLDCKAAQYALADATPEQKSEIIKDLLAFANAFRRADAFILLGVREVKGDRNTILGVAAHLEDAHLQQLVNEKTNRLLEFSYHALEIEGKQIGVLRIPQQARPTYLLQKYGKIAARTVYVRHGSSTAIATPEEIIAMARDASRADRDQVHEALERLRDNARFYQRAVRLWQQITRIPGHYVTNIPRPVEYEQERRGLHVDFEREYDAFRTVVQTSRDVLAHPSDRASPDEHAAFTAILDALRDLEWTLDQLVSATNSRLDVDLPQDRQREAQTAADTLSTLILQRLSHV